MSDTNISQIDTQETLNSCQATYLPHYSSKEGTVMPAINAVNVIGDPGLKPVYGRVNAAYASGDMEAYKQEKQQLPAIIWQATLKPGTSAQIANIDRVSGLVPLDFDHIRPEHMQDAFNRICADPHTMVAFVSPSGVGIKALVFSDFMQYGPVTNREYAAYYKQILHQMSGAYGLGPSADGQCCNMNRLCFVSGHEPFIRQGPAQVVQVEQYVAPVRPVQVVQTRTMEALRRLLFAVDPSRPRDDWYRVLAAYKRIDDGLLPMVDEWSSGGTNYQGFEDVETIFNSFSGPYDELTGEPVTLGSVERYARKDYVASVNLEVLVSQDMQALVDSQNDPGSLFTDPESQSEATFDSLVSFIKPGDIPEIQQAIAMIAVEADQVKVDHMINQLMDKAQTKKKIIEDGVKAVRKRAEDAAKGSEGGTPDMDSMLKNVVTLETGPFMYFDTAKRISITHGARLNSLYGHMWLGTNGTTKPDKWLGSKKDKRICHGMSWSPVPDAEISLEGRLYVNTYQPIQIIQKPDIRLLRDWLVLCKHILGRHRRLGLQYMAYMLQHPGEKVRWAVLVHGAPRTGKDFILQALKLILGSAFKVIDPKSSKDGWGDAYVGAKFITFAEVKDIGSDKFNELKTSIADDNIEDLNPKGKGIHKQKNLYGMWFNSNHDDCMKFSTNQDKILVIQSPDERMGPEFYDRLGNDMKRPEFAQAAYHLLMNMDLTGFTPGRMPERTEAMYAMCDAARGSAINGLIEAGENRTSPFSGPISSELEIRNWVFGQRFPGSGKISSGEISEVLEAIGWSRYVGKKKVDRKTKNTPRFIAPTVDCWWMTAPDLFDHFSRDNEV